MLGDETRKQELQYHVFGTRRRRRRRHKPRHVILREEEADINKLSVIHDDLTSELQRHFIRSINSSLSIRQLRSQGLSFQLWPAATTLVNLLDKQRSHPETNPLTPTLTALRDGSECRTLNILEIGSGTGLVGIAAAAALGAKVTVTDLSHVISNLQFNVEANADVVAAHGGCVRAASLHWGEPIDAELIGQEFDLILASDVVYHDHLYDPLIQTLRSSLFEVHVVHTDPPAPGSRIGVVVYRFAAKQSKKPAIVSAKRG